MFSDVEAFALLYLMKAVDEDRRASNARAVVEDLGLDPRLEPLVPMRPPRGKRLRAYERVLEGLVSISAMVEPERTAAIEQLSSMVAAKR